MSFIVDDLEQQCRRIVRVLRNQSSEQTPATFIAREIALKLDHLEVVRKRQRDLGRRFVNKELYIDSQIANLRNRPSLTNDWLGYMRLRNEFDRILDRAEWHAQRFAVEIESRLQDLQQRLLELVNMYDQLSLEHGDPTDSAKT